MDLSPFTSSELVIPASGVIWGLVWRGQVDLSKHNNKTGACRVPALMSTLFPRYRAHTSHSCPATCSLPPLLLPARPQPVLPAPWWTQWLWCSALQKKTNRPTLLIPNLLVKAFGIMEWMGLEGTLKTTESQPFEDVQGWSPTRLKAFAILKPGREFRPGLRSWTGPEDFT